MQTKVWGFQFFSQILRDPQILVPTTRILGLLKHIPMTVSLELYSGYSDEQLDILKHRRWNRAFFVSPQSPTTIFL